VVSFQPEWVAVFTGIRTLEPYNFANEIAISLKEAEWSVSDIERRLIVGEPLLLLGLLYRCALCLLRKRLVLLGV
jgi:hypothetical protein